jgi:tetratricopeptide (TPR) repeat protein
LINAGFGTPDASLTRALAVRGQKRLKADNAAGAVADLKRALEIANARQDPGMAKLDALRGVAVLTPAWRSMVSAKLAEGLLVSKDSAGAIAAVDAALLLDPRNASAFGVRARIAGTQNRWPAALADFDKALQIGIADPAERAFIHYFRGLSRMMEKRPVESQIADYDAAIQLDPTLTRAYLDRGDAMMQLGRPEDAARDYDIVTAKAPRYAEGLNSACWVRAAHLKREFAKARALCDQALALSDEANYRDSAGLVALQEGRWQDAWTHYDKAVAADAKMASARYGRGVAAKRLGRPADAKVDIAAAAALDASVAGKFAGYGQTP